MESTAAHTAIRSAALARHVAGVRIWPAMPAGSLRHVEQLPDASAMLVFRAASGGREADLSAAGAVSQALYKRTSVISLTVAVIFEPGGAYPFFGVPLHDLTDEHRPLEALWGSAGEQLRDALASCSSSDEIVRRIEQALVDRLEHAQDLELSAAVRTATAVRRLSSAKEVTDVGELARSLGLSGRQLRRAFTTAVGIGPKEYLRMLRFRRATASLSLPGAQVAAAAGFYDQAHLIGEFQHLARMTPRAFATRHEPSPFHMLPLRERRPTARETRAQNGRVDQGATSLRSP